MKLPIFTSCCTALVTPFLNGQINYPMLEQLLKQQISAGIRAVVVAGTTGESATLSDSEKLELIRRAKEYAGEECLIIAGTGSNDTAHAMALSAAAQDAGADALLVVSPYYNKATPEGIYAHYLSIAHSVRIPVIVYNVPTRTGVDIPVSVYKRLSRIPNIAGVKEASTDMVKLARTVYECGEELPVWSGNDDLAVAAMALGAKGLISVASNVVPEVVRMMTDAAMDGDFDSAADLQGKLLPLTDLLFCEVNPIPVKAAMKLRGYDCGECRLPLTPLSTGNLEKMKAYFAQ